MEQTIQRLTELIGAITKGFPDENDLKGFPGISRALILESLSECNGLLTTLKEHNNHFEVVLLKRESTEMFEKLFGELEENFDKIKPDKFNHILKLISKLRSFIRETYAAVINTAPIRTEAEIAKAREELALLTANNEQLKQINQELLDLKSTTVKNTSELTTEATTFRDNTRTLKDEVEGMKTTSATIVADFQEKQRIATENEGQITTFLGTIEETKNNVEKIKENTTQWQSDIKAAKENFDSKVEEFTRGNFKEVIDDISDNKTSDITKVLLCSGKIYFDLEQKRENDKRKDVAIIRMEQIYPLPLKQLEALYQKYNKSIWYWVQEEPLNMGAASYLRMNLTSINFGIISRQPSAAISSGFSKVHKEEQDEILNTAFSI